MIIYFDVSPPTLKNLSFQINILKTNVLQGERWCGIRWLV